MTDDSKAVQIWPPTGHTVSWPPPGGAMNDEELEAFMRGDHIVEAFRAQGIEVVIGPATGFRWDWEPRPRWALTPMPKPWKANKHWYGR